jgi:pilus assembly protein CpaE
MQRKAVVVAGATGNAGFDDPIDDVLARFAFAPAERLPSVARALARAREGRVDLLLVPLESGELDTLAADLVPVGATLVVGTSAQLAPDLMLRAMRAGVNEFLTTPVSGDELAAAVQRHLRRSQSDTTGRLTVAVYSPKGGLGTTSVAINLAHHLASRPRANGAALVDFVVGGGDVAVMLNLRPSFDIGDLALKIDQLDAALLDSVLARVPGNVRVLAASERRRPRRASTGRQSVAILAQLRAGSAYTVIDCEHHLSDRTLAAMDAADAWYS